MSQFTYALLISLPNFPVSPGLPCPCVKSLVPETQLLVVSPLPTTHSPPPSTTVYLGSTLFSNDVSTSQLTKLKTWAFLGCLFFPLSPPHPVRQSLSVLAPSPLVIISAPCSLPLQLRTDFPFNQTGTGLSPHPFSRLTGTMRSDGHCSSNFSPALSHFRNLGAVGEWWVLIAHQTWKCLKSVTERSWLFNSLPKRLPLFPILLFLCQHHILYPKWICLCLVLLSMPLLLSGRPSLLQVVNAQWRFIF